jgi:hypothetical protein
MASVLKKLTRVRGRKPRALLTIGQILEWADAHHAATGRWPSTSSGRIGQSRFGTSWKSVDVALRKGLHGTPAVSLAMFLHQRRGKKLRVDVEKARSPIQKSRKKKPTHVGDREKLSVERILDWADAHQAATGRWPTKTSGAITGVPGESWRTVADALVDGRRGLPGGKTLSRLLLQHRGGLGLNRLPDLTVRQILSWADAFYDTHGCWPSERRGKVAGASWETWTGIDRRLRQGGRGLPGGSSLSQLLAKHRGACGPRIPRGLSITQIVAWAKAHHAATGNWPNGNSGAVRGARRRTWRMIEEALRRGGHGLPRGLTLSRLLDQHRAKPGPDLTLGRILAWAEAHRAATGQWPTRRSGAVAGAPGEDWNVIDQALRRGRRGLPGGLSLLQLPGRKLAPMRTDLTIRQIRAWGQTHRAATGSWPTRNSGEVLGARDETWRGIDDCLQRGLRGLPCGFSVARLFQTDVSSRRPRLTVEQILAWGDAHHLATGEWPRAVGTPILGAPGEKWKSVNKALQLGHRGLPSGLSLSRLFDGRQVPQATDLRRTKKSRST